MDTSSLDLPLEDAIAPEADPALRAVWQSLFAVGLPRLSFEQALRDPVMRLCITNASLYRLRAERNRLVHGLPRPEVGA